MLGGIGIVYIISYGILCLNVAMCWLGDSYTKLKLSKSCFIVKFRHIIVCESPIATGCIFVLVTFILSIHFYLLSSFYTFWSFLWKHLMFLSSHCRFSVSPRFLMTAFKAFLNSPVGPKTTHFWGPVANWGFVIAVCVSSYMTDMN